MDLRTVLLPLFQPLFSVSVLDNLIHHDRKYPTDFTTAENCVYMQSIHLLAWLLTTCHVVIIVQVRSFICWLGCSVLTTCHVVITVQVSSLADLATFQLLCRHHCSGRVIHLPAAHYLSRRFHRLSLLSYC